MLWTIVWYYHAKHNLELYAILAKPKTDRPLSASSYLPEFSVRCIYDEREGETKAHSVLSIAGTLFAYKFKFISGEILFVITIYSRVLKPIPAHHGCRDCYHRHHRCPHHCHHTQFYRNYRQMLCQSVDSINLKHLKDFSDRMIYDHAESGMPSTRRARHKTPEPRTVPPSHASICAIMWWEWTTAYYYNNMAEACVWLCGSVFLFRMCENVFVLLLVFFRNVRSCGFSAPFFFGWFIAIVLLILFLWKDYAMAAMMMMMMIGCYLLYWFSWSNWRYTTRWTPSMNGKLNARLSSTSTQIAFLVINWVLIEMNWHFYCWTINTALKLD